MSATTHPATASSTAAVAETGPPQAVENGADSPMLDPARAEAWMWRVRHAVVIGVLLAVALNTDPGKVVNDTKLDLTLRPLALLQRALHLWDPLGSAGQLQNQAYGYLFPMGPFFALGDAVGLPSWVVQRLWWALVLAVSYAGFVVLARRLRIGTEWTRLVAGVAFALAPHVLTVLGSASIEIWPPALAPWVLVPLVGAGATGRPRRAAALSGLAVLAMGGVNAAVDLAALLPAVLWLLTRRWSLGWLRLVLWWAACVVAATLWWVVPLLTLGRFSPPFLDFIESAAYTTRTTSLVESLRGTADWVAYLGEAGSRAGYALLTQPLLLLMTVLLVVLGLVGVAWRRTPERVWLALCVVLGAALVTMGHVAPVDGPAAEEIRSALDGALAPLRNVHKFDILIRMALALGAASALALLSRGGRSVAEARFLRTVVAGAGAFVVLGATTPFFGLSASPTGAYDGVPSYWSQATTWLDEHSGTGRTLLLPGSRFAQYGWGATGDEPIQALAGTPWDVRNAVPLSSAGHIRWLDGIERQVADGRGGTTLREALTSGGVRYLLVRNDLAYGAAGATRPATVRAALSTTPGVSLVASFGPLTGGGGSPIAFSDQGLNLALPAVEIYRVDDPSDPRVELVPLDGVARVVGGAESVSLEGMPRTGQFVTLPQEGGTAAGPATGPLVLTDTPRRREANFGVGTFGTSQTLTESDPLRIAKPTRDYGFSGDADTASVAVTGGVRSISASSSASDSDSYPQSDPGSMPYAAFDGSMATQWRPNPLKPVVDSWLRADFGRPVSLGGARVTLDPNTAVTRLTLTTDRGKTTVPVDGDVAVLPAVRTTSLSLGFRAVEGDELAKSRAAIREVSVPGVAVTRTVRLPDPPDGEQPDRIVLSGDIGHGGCTLLGPRPLCAAGIARTGEDASGLDRTFTLPSSTSADVTVTATPVPDAALQRRVEEALGLEVHATSSSVAVPDLAGGPMAAVDGNLGTAWVASPDDPDPSLTLAWKGPRTIRSLQVVLDGYAAATRPSHLRITSPHGTREAEIDETGLAIFAPLRTDELTLHPTAAALASSLDAYTFRRTLVGLGFSDVRIAGVTPELRIPERASTVRVDFPCGAGPTVSVAGHTLETTISPTVGDLLASAPTLARVCRTDDEDATSVRVSLPAGTVNVVAPADDGWLTSAVVLATTNAAADDAAAAGTHEVRTWGATDRTVDVGARTSDSLLVVRENANPGWRAALDGRVLSSVVVAGWQQGFVVPPGAEGTVRLTFAPDTPFRAGLLVGLGLVVLLVVAALVPERRRKAWRLDPAGRTGARVVSVVGAALVVLMGGLWGAAVLALAVLTFAVVSRMGRGGHLVWPVAVGSTYLAAGVQLVLAPYASAAPAADSAPVQVLCLATLALLVVSLWSGPTARPARMEPLVPPGVGAPTG